jgi:spoIIIJ-associated protein
MKEIEIDGKSVTLAVENGLKELGLRRDQVEVEVLEEPAPGFLGLGGKPARVRIREKVYEPGMIPEEEGDDIGNRIAPAKPAAPRGGGAPRGSSHSAPRSAYHNDRGERRSSRGRSGPPRRTVEPRRPRVETPEDVDTAKACAEATKIIEQMLSLIGLSEPKLECSWDPKQFRVRAEVSTPDSELLIGPDGRSLEAFQFLATIMLGRKMDCPVAVQVECAGHWKKVESDILAEVERAVDEVVKTGKPYRFEPMEPALRRLIHRTVQSHPEVETVSEGEGSWRKVVLKPKAK